MKKPIYLFITLFAFIAFSLNSCKDGDGDGETDEVCACFEKAGRDKEKLRACVPDMDDKEGEAKWKECQKAKKENKTSGGDICECLINAQSEEEALACDETKSLEELRQIVEECYEVMED